jgi:succinate dehydrogenase / fumarate reductase, cytochrome b subunit
MNSIKILFRSSLGKKYLMAATGLVLFFFVVAHLLGNLQFFLGPEVLNRYGHLLQSNVELLWPARISLLIIVALHIYAAVQVTIENRRARTIPYAGSPAPPAASYASRTMFMSGLIIAAFIAYHLLHFTVRTQAINFTGRDFALLKESAHGVERADVFAMIVLGFSNPWVSLFYLIGVGLLCFHLSHGIQAAFASIGLRNRMWGEILHRASPVIATVIYLGYASIPVAVLLGFGKEALR